MLNSNNNVYLLDEEQYTKKRKAPLSPEKQSKILGECKKNMSRWFDYFSLNITRFRNDKYFFQSEQWDTQAWAEYTQLGKNPYTFNKLKPLVRQLMGEQVNMQPKLNLVPTNNDSANPNNVLMMSKFLRALAYGSHASQAYATCFKNQCIGGWGVIKVSTDYEDPYKFDQTIEIKPVDDPLSVGFDPNAQKSNKTDGSFQFCYEIMDKDDFEATYPTAKVPTGGQMLGTARSFLPQIDRKSVVITEYYVKDYKSKVLIQLTNNINFKQDVLKEDVEEVTRQYEQSMAMQGVPANLITPLVESNRRKTKLTFITCYKCTSEEVLDHYDWPSTKLPFVFVDALSSFQDGSQYTESFIRPAKDAQKSYNYAMSEAINGLPRLRREQVYMTAEEMKGYEEVYRHPDRQQGVIPYNRDPMTQGPLFRPPEELPQTFFQLAAAAEEDIYKTLGLSPASRGELPNQTSGVAIGRTITQGNLSFVQMMQNLYDGMQAIGEIVLELVPKLYDTERVVSVVDETGQSRTVTLNEAKGNKVENNVMDTLYKLEVQPVASFTIQQELIRDSLYKLASVNPEVAPLVLDLIGSTIQSPIAPRLVERLKTLVPTHILRQEEGLPPLPPGPPSPQEELIHAQIQKVKSEAMQAEASAMNNKDDLSLKSQKMQNELHQSGIETAVNLERLQVERDQAAADTEKAYVDANAEIQKAELDHSASVMRVLADMHKAEQDANKRV